MQSLSPQNPKEDALLERALEGDIHSFQALFGAFQGQLRSYLYRLTASRDDAEDIAHDVFIRAFDRLSTFEGRSTLKTWVFQIATNLAFNELKRRKRWTADVSARAKELVINHPPLVRETERSLQATPEARYEIAEHIDTCFTCSARNLPVENQIALILKDLCARGNARRGRATGFRGRHGNRRTPALFQHLYDLCVVWSPALQRKPALDRHCGKLGNRLL